MYIEMPIVHAHITTIISKQNANLSKVNEINGQIKKKKKKRKNNETNVKRGV